jgi:hypothetical protein
MSHAWSTGRGLLNAALGAAAGSAKWAVTPLASIAGVGLAKEAEEACLLSKASASTVSEQDARELMKTRQVVGLIKKNPFITGSTAESRKLAAMAKFWKPITIIA